MMRFQDFLARAHRLFRVADWMDTRLKVPPLSESHVFNLGEDSEWSQAIKAVDLDIREEMKARIPMPFRDVSCVSIVRRDMSEEQRAEMVRSIKSLYPERRIESFDPGEDKPVWVLDRLIELDESHPVVRDIVEDPGNVDMSEVIQWFLMVRVHGVEREEPPPMAWVFGYGGLGEDGRVRIISLNLVRAMANEMAEALRYVTAISHPVHYVVRVTPKLTPHEERRVKGGHRLPGTKTPHFIVVTHRVLVGMRRDPEGHHASPVPHERRGHWRRLAERCRLARESGKRRTFVRPSFVGSRTWQNQANVYEVLSDFGKESVYDQGCRSAGRPEADA